MARGVVVGVIAAVVVGVGWLAVEYAPPAVDDELVADVLPAIDRELERGPWRGLLALSRPELGPRWFCVEQVVEIRRVGDVVSVGLVARCEDYARDGDVLLTGSGEHAPKVVELVAERGDYRVTAVDDSPDGGSEDWWLEHEFSENGARRLDDVLHDADTAPEAREAFGLPPNAPVEQV